MENIEKIEFKKERDFGEVFGATFEFIRNNFKKLFLSLLFIGGPGILLIAAASIFYNSSIYSVNKSLGTTAISFLFMVLSFVISLTLIQTVTYAFIDLYLDKEKNDFEVNDVWQKVKEYYFSFIGTNILVVIVIFFASLLLIIPGIYFSVIYTVIYMIRMREGISTFDAMKRCKFLVKDKWWLTAGLLVVFGVMQGMLSFILSIPGYVIFFISYMNNLEGPVNSGNNLGLNITSILSSVGYLFYALPCIGFAFHYYSLVENKEATGLLEKIDAIKEPDLN